MSNKSKNKRVEICLIVAATCVVVTGLWAVLATPETALAKKPIKPDTVVKGDVEFLVHEGFGSEIVGGATKAAAPDYRALMCNGSVVVTLADGTVLDQKPFIRRFEDEVTGDRHLAFRITLQGGHKVRDRYSTPTPSEGIGNPEDPVILFPETTVDPGDGSPWLEVLAGGVDENLDMLPGAHVILHLHVADVPLINIGSLCTGEMIGTISVGDIEFTMPE